MTHTLTISAGLIQRLGNKGEQAGAEVAEFIGTRLRFRPEISTEKIAG